MDPTPETRRRRTPTQRFRDFLSRQGFRPWRDAGDAPGTLWFNFEGLRFAARLEDGDAGYVQLALGYVLDEESRDELTLLRAANELQAATKVVKVFVPPDRDYVELQAELFLDGPAMAPPVLQRCLLTLRGASADFLSRVRPEAPRARA